MDSLWMRSKPTPARLRKASWEDDALLERGPVIILAVPWDPFIVRNGTEKDGLAVRYECRLPDGTLEPM